MNHERLIHILSDSRWYDLTQALSIFTPPWPGEMPLQVYFFKRLTGSWGGGQGANGQIIEWSNNTGTHLVGPRAFHSGARAMADIPLSDLCGEGVVVDISDAVSDYSFYTPEMITGRVRVKEGDILLINTGYHKHGWDQPDTPNPAAQGGIENKEFGYYVRHPGPSPEFFRWALDMKLKLIGVDCGSAEHPMNTSIRTMHGREFEKAEAKLKETHGRSWDEMFPPEAYHELTRVVMPKAGLLLAESLGGEIGQLSNQRAWMMMMPIPFMEVESAWCRAVALQGPAGMSEDEFFGLMRSAGVLDMTLPFSVQTPQWANYEPLSVKYTKRVGGQYFGLGRNNAHCRASFHLATHMDGEKHFWAAGRTIGQMPFDYWFGPGVIADISNMVSNSSVYTPAMVESVAEVREGDILIIKTGWHKYGWNSPDSDEFRYMIKHPGPSPDFADWCLEKKIKWLGVDCVAMEHPMNTIQRLWHPKTFEEADRKLMEQYGKNWDEMYPLDKYYQDMHLNLFPKGIVHAENLGMDIALAESGRYFIAGFLQKAMETTSMWGRFVAFK
ncbi:MAG: cyclase family protein [Chloroflexi bacterium]|nr:cyclase family protein [Chloroflexota bacterium]MCI0644295.1 cyclase family protein [Chloroflexota bacterium]MCI0726278.1 cyclase family protein [Chloroflexota bacterium]